MSLLPKPPQVCLSSLEIGGWFLPLDRGLYGASPRLAGVGHSLPQGLQLERVEAPDLSMVMQPDHLRIEDMPSRRRNFLDLQSAIELFTPIYQLFLTDDDFWRATNSLQLDETIGIYAATILGAESRLGLVNNKHPLVPMSTLRAGYRLSLHGLSTEMLHGYLMQLKAERGASPEHVGL